MIYRMTSEIEKLDRGDLVLTWIPSLDQPSQSLSLFRFKNMVRGLEDDEVDFLELVDRSKLQEEIRVRTEENTAIAEYRCVG